MVDPFPPRLDQPNGEAYLREILRGKGGKLGGKGATYVVEGYYVVELVNSEFLILRSITTALYRFEPVVIGCECRTHRPRTNINRFRVTLKH